MLLIKSSKSTTSLLDAIPTTLLKQFLTTLCKPITEIINKFQRLLIYPSYFKKSLILLLLKNPKSDPADMNDYRPVSNLCFIYKVL